MRSAKPQHACTGPAVARILFARARSGFTFVSPVRLLDSTAVYRTSHVAFFRRFPILSKGIATEAGIVSRSPVIGGVGQNAAPEPHQAAEGEDCDDC